MSVRRINKSSTSLLKETNKDSRASIYKDHFGLQKKLSRTPGIPRAANWGWSYLHFSGKAMMVGVFAGLVSLTTPYWAHFKVDISNSVTFGLWHCCSDKKCSSIHDNLVDGQSVPIWFHLVQGMLCIGVACSIIGLAIIANSIEGNIVRMTPTVHLTSSSILAISAMEHFIALYVFTTYIEEAQFLFHRVRSLHYALEFHGSIYMGIVSFLCSIVGALSIYLDDSLCQSNRRRHSKRVQGVYGNEEQYLKMDPVFIGPNGPYIRLQGENGEEKYMPVNDGGFEVYEGGEKEYTYLNEGYDTYGDAYDDYYDEERFNDFAKYNPNQ